VTRTPLREGRRDISPNESGDRELRPHKKIHSSAHSGPGMQPYLEIGSPQRPQVPVGSAARGVLVEREVRTHMYRM
jgi:hypothetical protein